MTTSPWSSLRLASTSLHRVMLLSRGRRAPMSSFSALSSSTSLSSAASYHHHHPLSRPLVLPLTNNYSCLYRNHSNSTTSKKSSSSSSSSSREPTKGAQEAHARAQITSNKELSSILQQFPQGIDYSFGYGSMVLSQNSDNSNNNNNISNNNHDNNNKSMIDIILAVQDPHAWHTQNLQRYPHHYSSFSRIGGPSFVTWLQTNFGARLFFHPFVDLTITTPIIDDDTHGHDDHDDRTTKTHHQKIKYGVVSTKDLISDLTNWEYLYLAGRMHKPIVEIDNTEVIGPNDNNDTAVSRDEIEEAQRINLLTAVSASLLLLPPPPLPSSLSSFPKNADTATTTQATTKNTVQSIPLSQLYNTIASLSYTGDFRMETGAEDPNKIQKLVQTPGMLELWDIKYKETLQELENIGILEVVDGNNATSTSSSSDSGVDIGNGGEERNSSSSSLQIESCNPLVRQHLMQNLPLKLRNYSKDIDTLGNNKYDHDDDYDNDKLRRMIHHGNKLLKRELSNIVAPAAKSQSVKGFFTAGVGKSWRYAMAKFAKGRLRK